ncbi:Acid stress protein IbaG [Buchnera aphidicola (Cinara pseudotaxifoliae)]|uniref:Acid stress protein IbaG n=1 Tax=Buchnera aphidicola (Cinara pseudotaxifoliae) TaxID=655384 RepID=A0A451DH98_9GAMM|nr:BolA/IbaG family iron-sulfur metabolism protein [Buchnera aphidicola]VFP86000.1 Acid stress protein IbaG [Buchnera aphidicola (Cinara pseudotaxifoliae)]
MQLDKIQNTIKNQLNLKKVLISNHNNHFLITAIGNSFIGMNSLKRQKSIYKILMPYFLTKEIHAVQIQAYTVSEWDQKKFNEK